jgi:hypothetical protein
MHKGTAMFPGMSLKNKVMLLIRALAYVWWQRWQSVMAKMFEPSFYKKEAKAYEYRKTRMDYEVSLPEIKTGGGR